MFRRTARRQAAQGLLLGLILLAPLSARGEDSSAVLVDECVKEVLARHELFDPQWVRFKATDVLVVPPVGTEGTNFGLEVEYAIKGGKRRSWCKILTGGEKLPLWDREVWFIDNGEVQASKGRDEKRTRLPANANRITPWSNHLCRWPAKTTFIVP